jgi:predicted KAP-like P-loop ATPase
MDLSGNFPRKNGRRNQRRIGFSADRPIKRASEDKLGRDSFAKNLAHSIRGWHGKDSLVIALCGEWGCGKTSLKNLALGHLNRGLRNKIPVLEFNPWEISGHGDITAGFLGDLAKLLPEKITSCALERLGETSGKIKRYARLIKAGGIIAGKFGKFITSFAPVTGTTMATVGNSLASGASTVQETSLAVEETSEEEPLSLAELKAEIVKGMGALKAPIFAVIDDIDRLTTEEIREVFQLVKSNANFPNLVFLLMFDRVIVGEALNQVVGNRGDEFLDKIVQVPFDVPEPSFNKIQEALFSNLDLLLGDKAIAKHWNRDRWGRLWHGAMALYFRTLRHVYRFLGPLEFLVGQTEGAGFVFNFVDMLGIETLRVFEPALYNRLRQERNLLCGCATRWVFDEKEAEATIKAQFEALLGLVPGPRRRRAQTFLRCSSLVVSLQNQGAVTNYLENYASAMRRLLTAILS